ncbi:MAG: PorV/PorQ family protein [bacterium]
MIMLTANCFIYAAGPGTSAANFLKLGIGARAIGMGESFTAVADDVNALYWNPAGLGFLKSKEITASHNVWFQDIKYDFIGFAIPVSGKSSGGDIFVDGKRVPAVQGIPGVIGISATYLYMEGIERRSGNTADPDGYFGASDMSLSLSYAQQVLKFSNDSMVTSGINLKVISQQIDDKKARAYAVDLGVISRLNQWSFGFVVQNIGSQIKFIEKSYPLPLTYKFGAAYYLLNRSLSISLDLNKPIDNKINFNLGSEYWVGGMFALRAGYLRKDSMSREALVGKGLGSMNDGGLASLTGMMAGAGFRIFNYGVDYAFVPYGDLGATHRFTMNMKF